MSVCVYLRDVPDILAELAGNCTVREPRFAITILYSRLVATVPSRSSEKTKVCLVGTESAYVLCHCPRRLGLAQGF